MQHPALILIDIQRGFNDPIWGKRNNPNFERHIARLLEFWRREGWPLFHIQHNSIRPESPLNPRCAGHAFMECAEPLHNEIVVSKTVNSALIGTDLQKLLIERRVHDLLLVGFTTDHCVSTTTRMAANLGFNCIIPFEGVATFERRAANGRVIAADDVHETNLASLDGEFARVVPIESILNQEIFR